MLGVLAQLTPLPEDTGNGIDVPEVAWDALGPILVLVAGALLLLTLSALVPRERHPRGIYAGFTVGTALFAIGAAVPLWVRVQDADRGPFSAMAGAVGIDGFSMFATIVICASVVLAALLADGYLRREGLDGPELYVLMLLSASGGLMMAAANDLIVMFLGLEILSISVYVVAAMHLRRLTSQEAAIKYFVLGAFSSAFFLYGIALVYGATGTTNLARMLTFFSENVLADRGLLLAGVALLLVGFGFKVAAVPFHAWTPDVYQGAPSPAVAYMASGVKAAGFAGLLRVLFLGFQTYSVDWQPIVYGLAALTLVVGSVLAVVQRNIKRMMAYSSISHAGFVLVGVQAASERGTAAALFYLASYTFMIVGTFGVITLVGRRGDARHDIDDYRGLAARRPLLAFVFTVFLLAQAGVPFTSGFFAKFYVIAAAAEEHSYGLALVAMLSAVVAAFVYLRVTVSMYMGDDGADAGSGEAPEATAAAAPPVRVPVAAGVALAIALAFTVVVGVLPDPVVDVARDAVPALVASR
jgi:NADH-quinone oxidoreductase subunit N